MLNVPEAVKTLFKSDGIRKNFRVQFPDGELPDITNENIVQESVKFTESLCSQDVLKFGLTEASVIEFETVGVANMYGMTIECGIEIDLSSLSASEIAEIAAGSWDGVYVSESDTDIGFPFFRVPFGAFRVESCPRDHQAMTHRRVQAYSQSPQQLQMSNYEKNKLTTLTKEQAYTPDLYKLFLSQFGHNNQDLLLSKGFTVGAPISTVFDDRLAFINALLSENITLISAGNEKTIRCRVKYLVGYTSGSQLYRYDVNRDKLYCVNYGDSSPDTILGRVTDALRAGSVLPDIDLEASGFSSWEELATAFSISKGASYSQGKKLKMFYPQVRYTPDNWFTISEEDKAIYPRIGDDSDQNGSETIYRTRCFFMIPTVVQIEYTNGTVLYTENISSPITINQYNEPLGLPSFPASFDPTFDADGLRSFIDSYSLPDIMNGMLEMQAAFGKINRSGTREISRLSNTSPAAVHSGEFSGFWWDEYDVSPIGMVRFSFTGEDKKENVIDYYFGAGDSGYDMTGNAALKAMTGQAEDTIEGLLDVHFIPHLGPIAFTPIDLDMKGLPYIEAGDYLAVTAEDSMIAYSFAMRQEISGVQILDAHIESTSGDIIESEASM